MGRFLERIQKNDPAYRVRASDDGYLLIRRDGQDIAFNAFARELIDDASGEFVVLPTTDGARGYERVFVIPI